MWKRITIAVLGAALISAFAQPVPQSPYVRQSSTNGSMLLAWTYGDYHLNSISNVTTRNTIDTGFFNTYLVSGLPVGSTNVFVVVNAAGASNTATGVAQPFVLKASIKPYTYLVTVPTSTNAVTRILTSTNLKVWTTFKFVTNLGPTYQFVWTNDNGTRFFHSVSP